MTFPFGREARRTRAYRFAGFLMLAVLVAAVYGLVRGSAWDFVNVVIGGAILAVLLTLWPRSRGG